MRRMALGLVMCDSAASLGLSGEGPVISSQRRSFILSSVGSDKLEEIIETQGELHSFRTLQKQPFQRTRTLEQQLRVFLGNRKIRYAPLLVDALDLARVPRPLNELLAAVAAGPA